MPIVGARRTLRFFERYERAHPPRLGQNGRLLGLVGGFHKPCTKLFQLHLPRATTTQFASTFNRSHVFQIPGYLATVRSLPIEATTVTSGCLSVNQRDSRTRRSSGGLECLNSGEFSYRQGSSPHSEAVKKSNQGDFLIEMRRCRISIGTRTVVPVDSPTSNSKTRCFELHEQCVRKPKKRFSHTPSPWSDFFTASQRWQGRFGIVRPAVARVSVGLRRWALQAVHVMASTSDSNDSMSAIYQKSYQTCGRRFRSRFRTTGTTPVSSTRSCGRSIRSMR